MSQPLPRGFAPWLIGSVVVLVGSLGLLAIAVTAAFWTFAAQSAPLWVVVLGALSVFGILLGFGGLFVLLAVAGFRAWRESRRVQVLAPEPASTGSNPTGQPPHTPDTVER